MIKKNLNIILIGICFLLIGNFGFGQVGQIVDFNKENPYQKVFIDTDNFGASYLDILAESVDKIENDTIKYSMLNDLAYYWHTRNLIIALNFTRKGLSITKEKKNVLWEGRFQITQGAILLRLERLDEAFDVLQDATSKIEEVDLPLLYTQLGYVFERKGDLDNAAAYAMEAMKIGKKLGDNHAIAVAFSDLSYLFWKQSKFEKALEYGLKSIELFEQRGLHDLDYDFTLYVVGNNYMSLKNYDEAQKYFQHSLSIGERYGFYNNLSDVYISLIELYALLNKFDEAEKASTNAIKYAELLNNDYLLMRSWLSIGKLQNSQGKYISAIKSLKRCIEVATEDFGDKYFLSQAYELLGKAYAFNHNYQDAYIALAEYDKLKKEIFTVEADQRISKIQTEFDVAEKEGTIELQGLTIKKQKVTQTLIIVFASLLFLLLLLIYIAYQNIRVKRIQLQKQNLEKEFLLKEIHHRVKNNLGIVTSLLELQSEQTVDTNVVDAMQATQNRVYSMSLIHQRLYQGKNLAAINMNDYFINLGGHVINSYGAENRIELDCDIDPIDLDIDTATPLGLIVNELITNALKYAFPDHRKGIIKICLKRKINNILELEVIDNGIGLNENEIIETGFGTQLIKLLIQQLDGKMTYKSKEGTSVFFEFKLDKAA